MKLRLRIVAVLSVCIAALSSAGGDESAGETGPDGLLQHFADWFITGPLSSDELRALRLQGRPESWHVDMAPRMRSIFISEGRKAVDENVITKIKEALLHRAPLDERATEDGKPRTDWSLVKCHHVPGGYVTNVTGMEAGIVFITEHTFEVFPMLQDMEVSASCAGERLTLLAGRDLSGAQGGAGVIVVLDGTVMPPAVVKRIRLRDAIWAANWTSDGSVVALTQTSILRVEADGAQSVAYGSVGFFPSELNSISWRRTNTTSMVAFGSDFLIGTEFGMIWVRWVPEMQSYDENWLFPPEMHDVLLDVKDIHVVGPLRR